MLYLNLAQNSQKMAGKSHGSPSSGPGTTTSPAPPAVPLTPRRSAARPRSAPRRAARDRPPFRPHQGPLAGRKTSVLRCQDAEPTAVEHGWTNVPCKCPVGTSKTHFRSPSDFMQKSAKSCVVVAEGVVVDQVQQPCQTICRTICKTN